MKYYNIILFALTTAMMISCSKRIKYSEEFKSQTQGRYLYDSDDVIDVYYEDNTLMLNWREGTIKPVVLDETTFFVSDMYKKLQFVKKSNTNNWFLSIVPEDADTSSTFDYPKVSDNYKTAYMHFKDKEYKEATEAYLKMRKEDSTAEIIRERELNFVGYDFLRKKQYDKAIEIFKMNVALYPDSDNVYDSLADAYLRSGDSLNAYENYSKALDLNSRNRRAEEFINMYEQKQNSEE